MEKVLFGRRNDENKASCKGPNEMTSNHTKENGFTENNKTESIDL